MAEVAQMGAKTGPKAGVNQAVIEGMVKSVGTFEIKGKRVHEAVVAIAAADKYSMPGVVSVQSSYRLGSPGDEVSVVVSVTGIPNNWADRNTGERKESANVRLVVVE